jgi:ABC-type antimicrobial peptide transport system permease subunit
MDTTTGIRMVAGIVFLVVFLGMLALAIAYILTLSRALQKCSPSSRTMQPAMVWLLLIPLFNLIWNFLIVNAISESLTKEFRLRGVLFFESEPGKRIGMPMAVCGACSVIPILGILASLAYFVLWIVYWVKVSGFSKMLDQTPAAVTAPLTR